ncbi:MAG: TrkH family potassium uptake protein [Pseudomonadota bacterium]
MRIRPVLLAIGVMVALLGVAMVPSALIDLADQDTERGANWRIFAGSAIICITIGLVAVGLAGKNNRATGPKEAFVLTVLVWTFLPAVAAIPFVLSNYSITDGWFESVSGLTTTGSTVLTGLDLMPRGLLLWRAILQWIGGIGIIVTAIAILPMLRVGGMQLFQLESSDMSGKFLPRVTEIAAQTGLVYLGLTIACAVLYDINGMNTFDCITHAMTTMAAGGYSTHDESFAYFGSGASSVAILFMILAGLPFASFVLLLRGNPRPFLRDSQPRLYLAIMVAAIIIMLLYNSIGQGSAVFDDFDEALRNTAFSVVSVMTGTGYANTNYGAWGPGSTAMFLMLMFLGGCAGSAACGMKIFRLEISVRAIVAHAKRMVSPNRLAPVRYNGRVVDEDTIQSVLVFMFLYLATFMITSALLGLTENVDAVTAISGAATSVSNVGPGLGSLIGPKGTFQSLSDPAKWICSFAMLLGRLEFIAMFVVLTPRFWRG